MNWNKSDTGCLGMRPFKQFRYGSIPAYKMRECLKNRRLPAFVQTDQCITGQLIRPSNSSSTSSIPLKFLIVNFVIEGTEHPFKKASFWIARYQTLPKTFAWRIPSCSAERYMGSRKKDQGWKLLRREQEPPTPHHTQSLIPSLLTCEHHSDSFGPNVRGFNTLIDGQEALSVPAMLRTRILIPHQHRTKNQSSFAYWPIARHYKSSSCGDSRSPGPARWADIRQKPPCTYARLPICWSAREVSVWRRRPWIV